MDRGSESDLLFVLLGLQMNFFTRDQVVEAGALWSSRPDRRLPDLLEERGFLKKSTRSVIEALVAEHAERLGGGDPGQSLARLPIEEDVRRSLLGIPFGDGLKEALRGLPPAAPTGASDTVTLAPLREDRYEMGAEIGRGGLGRVVEAKDRVLGRGVAIKEMMRETGSTDLLKRFLREGEIAGRLSHPNVIPVHDIGIREEGARRVPYFVMARIFGRDLKEILEAVERGGFAVRPETELLDDLPVLDDEGEAAPAEPVLPAKAVLAGDPRRQFSRPRLLRIFQDVCLAVAYAHDRGIIHRDLKPANVMVGDYGEVYVVDWGLAKDTGGVDRSDPSDRSDRSDAPSSRGDGKGVVTLDGEVIGTPAYMPPEQARGRVSEVDRRSDLYSLGAILYEILAFRPPYEGETAMAVLGQVLKGDLEPPSVRVSQRGKASGRAPAFAPDPVPPELDEIVLKAMARDKKDRYASALELHEDVQAFMEGEKQREYTRQRALAKVAEGEILAGQMEKMRAELQALEREAAEKEREIKPFWPAERKKDLWALQERVRNLRRRIVEAFTEAGSTFQAALEFERGNREARAALAELYWNQFLREEAAGNEAGTVRYENLVRRYNDGAFDARLAGDGTLSVATRSYPCRCLLDGRRVDPGEFECSGRGARGVGHLQDACAPCPEPRAPRPSSSIGRGNALPSDQDDQSPTKPKAKSDQANQGIMGYHPLSGRSLDGRKGAEGLPDFEPREPVRLRVHGAACAPEPLEGADAWLFRYVERGKVLVPVLPTGAAGGATGRSPLPAACPEDVLDRLYDPGSPFRPTEGLYLGRTPVSPLQVPMGSYLLVLAGPEREETRGAGDRGQGARPAACAPGPVPRAPTPGEAFAPVRVPVLIGRNAHESLEVTLYREGEIPEGFVQVPAGKFIYQGDPENPQSTKKAVVDLGDFFVAKFPATCREYAEFLNDLATPDRPDGASRQTDSPDPKTGLGPAEKRVPREAEEAGPYWPWGPDGRVAVPTAAWKAAAPEPLRGRARPLLNLAVDWEEDWPVFSVSWEDAMAYALWRSRKAGRLFTLPHEAEWEKAARGVDGRWFPCGFEDDATFSNTNLTFEDGMRPAPVDSFPADESPCGARGMEGNASDHCLNDPGDPYPGWRIFRGGAFLYTDFYLRAARRGGGRSTMPGYHCSIRLCFRVQPAASAKGLTREE